MQFLLATVPDPIDWSTTWQFDPYVDAIRQGIEASGYLLDRFHLPDAGVDKKGAGSTRDLHTHWPGVVLFRSKATDSPPFVPGQESLLVLFLVPETPVAGIHAEPFVRAIDFATGWMSRHRSAQGDGIRILGPSFSGSTPSLVRALRDVDARVGARLGRAEVTLVSGSASNDGNRHAFESPDAPYGHMTVHFRATIHSNSAVDLASRCFLNEIGVHGPFAYLSEGSTAYGSARDAGKAGPQNSGESCAVDSSATGKDVTIKFPFNIAQLRSDASRSGGPRQDPLAGVLPGLRPLPLEDVTTPTDQLPLQTPTTTAPSVELVLTNLLDAIRRENVRVVSVSATDVRDKLFLVREIRQHAPDVLLITTDADLFQVHPDETPWLKGVLVASTYPLHASSQDFVYPFRGRGAAERPNADLVQFSSVSMEGLHNAALALLNYDADGRAPAAHDCEGGDEERFASKPWLPRLVDYGGLAANCTAGEPAVWISVVGDGQLVPLRSYCNLEERMNLSEAERYVFRPALPPIGPPASTHRIPVSSASELLVIVIGLASGVLCLVAWLERDAALSARRGAFAVLVCGPIIALTFLGVALPALAWQQYLAGDAFAAGVTTTAAVVCLIEWIGGLMFQWRSRSRYYSPLRALFLLAALAVGVYAVVHLRASPQLFLLRTFDVGTLMSPLLAVVVFAAIPVAPAGVELWRLQALGVTVEDGDQVPD